MSILYFFNLDKYDLRSQNARIFWEKVEVYKCYKKKR